VAFSAPDRKSDNPIDACLSTSHYGVSHANFTVDEIKRALVSGPAKTR
jgi:hypothetical protein